MKTAIVTGASKGVGLATVKLLSENGYRVIAVSRNLSKIVDGGNSVVSVLNYAHIFHVCVQAQRDKGVFFCRRHWRCKRHRKLWW